MVDWGIGRYEETAAALEPAAAHLVELAAVRAGDRLLDVGCGTGNAALAAARSGATVTGLDPSARLLEVAEERFRAERLDGSFVVGVAGDLPFPDKTFDVVVSVFGVIFAPEAEQALSELVRVLHADGRAFVSVWLPVGAIDAMLTVFGRAVAAATGSTPKRFPWHELEAVERVAARAGATVTAHEGSVAFVDDSPEAYLDAQERSHPMAIASRPLLESAGVHASVREESLAVLREGNEAPGSFRVTSPYRVLELRRQ